MRGAPPVDAGRSYMGTFSVTNPWSCWLLGMGAELLALDPEKIMRSNRLGVAPACPEATATGANGHRMVYRPGAWRCYRHEGIDPPTILMSVKLDRAPKGDVLSRVNEALDYQFDERAGKFVITVLDLPKPKKKQQHRRSAKGRKR